MTSHFEQVYPLVTLFLSDFHQMMAHLLELYYSIACMSPNYMKICCHDLFSQIMQWQYRYDPYHFDFLGIYPTLLVYRRKVVTPLRDLSGCILSIGHSALLH